ARRPKNQTRSGLRFPWAHSPAIGPAASTSAAATTTAATRRLGAKHHVTLTAGLSSAHDGALDGILVAAFRRRLQLSSLGSQVLRLHQKLVVILPDHRQSPGLQPACAAGIVLECLGNDL